VRYYGFHTINKVFVSALSVSAISATNLPHLMGWEIVDYYDDNNRIAYRKNVIRKEFERLVIDLREGWIDGIVSYDLDPNWRQPKDLERVIDIYDERAGLVIATLQRRY
jgi:site-specific DNA recombinase